MKKIIFLSLILMISILSLGNSKRTNELITIKYSEDPFRTFEIVGTEINGVELKNLTEVLRKYKKENPNSKFELLSKIKSKSETVNKIKKAINDAGINLEHFWVPVSFDTKEDSPHGPGYIDIIKQKLNL